MAPPSPSVTYLHITTAMSPSVRSNPRDGQPWHALPLAFAVHAAVLALLLINAERRREEPPTQTIEMAYETAPAAQSIAAEANTERSAPALPEPPAPAQSEPVPAAPQPEPAAQLPRLMPSEPDQVTAPSGPRSEPLRPAPTAEPPQPAPRASRPRAHVPPTASAPSHAQARQAPKQAMEPLSPSSAVTDTSVGTPGIAPKSAAAAPAPAVNLTGAWRGALAAWLAAHRTYPDLARRDGVEGRVVVRFVMDGGGVVGEVTIVGSSGSTMLDQAATAMLRGAHLPAPPAPAPNSITITLPIHYSLAE
jgi:periplasmic protein TonB